MSETYKINGHIYRAYPTRYYCDGIEISPAEFHIAISSYYPKVRHY